VVEPEVLNEIAAISGEGSVCAGGTRNAIAVSKLIQMIPLVMLEQLRLRSPTSSTLLVLAFPPVVRTTSRVPAQAPRPIGFWRAVRGIDLLRKSFWPLEVFREFGFDAHG
jgi:hypothetical protein